MPKKDPAPPLPKGENRNRAAMPFELEDLIAAAVAAVTFRRPWRRRNTAGENRKKA